MKSRMKTSIVWFIAIAAVLLIVSQYLIHLADFVANYIGYFASAGLIPFMFGLATGVVVSRLSVDEYRGSVLLRTVGISVVVGIVALLPVIHAYVMMSKE